MGILSSKLIASIQRLRDRTFISQIEVLAKESTSNSAGGTTDTWSTVATYPGRLRHAREQDYLEISGGEQMFVGSWLVMLPTTAAVDLTNRIRVNGRVFAIIGDDGIRTDALVQTLRCDPAPEVG